MTKEEHLKALQELDKNSNMAVDTLFYKYLDEHSDDITDEVEEFLQDWVDNQ